MSTPGQVQYDYEESRYWSQQQATISPVCRLAPTTPIDVSIALLTLKTLQCSFAVKSGGHAAFTGASNINGGVTIDLLNMNTVAVSTDKKQVSYGAGARWIEVYNVLVPQGLGVVGGRVADIGVGGLTLGGGISFFSGSFGWACDTVNNYEVSCGIPQEKLTLTSCRLCLLMEASARLAKRHIPIYILLFEEAETTLA